MIGLVLICHTKAWIYVPVQGLAAALQLDLLETLDLSRLALTRSPHYLHTTH